MHTHTEQHGDGDDESEAEMEEVSGYHFMDCVPLFVSYVYITSGKRIRACVLVFLLCNSRL